MRCRQFNADKVSPADRTPSPASRTPSPADRTPSPASRTPSPADRTSSPRLLPALTFISAILLLATVFLPRAVYAKKVTFEFTELMCVCKVTVDDTKVKPDELKKFIEFLNSGLEMGRFASFDNTDAPKETEKLLQEVEEMRVRNLARIPAENVIKNTSWKKERIHYVFEAELQYRLDRANLEYRKTRDVKHLLQPVGDRPIPKECEKFAHALPSPAILLPVAKELAEKACKDNRNEGLCKSKYYADPKDSAQVDVVRANVLNFGWHNCVNAQRQVTQANQRMRAELEKIYEKHSCECDD